MSDTRAQARKQLARETFGRELTNEQVLALGPRIDAAVRNVRILAAWEAQLEGVEPAAVHATPAVVPGAGHD